MGASLIEITIRGTGWYCSASYCKVKNKNGEQNEFYHRKEKYFRSN